MIWLFILFWIIVVCIIFLLYYYSMFALNNSDIGWYKFYLWSSMVFWPSNNRGAWCVYTSEKNFWVVNLIMRCSLEWSWTAPLLEIEFNSSAACFFVFHGEMGRPESLHIVVSGTIIWRRSENKRTSQVKFALIYISVISASIEDRPHSICDLCWFYNMLRIGKTKLISHLESGV